MGIGHNTADTSGAWLLPLVGTTVDKAHLGSQLVCLLGATAAGERGEGEGCEGEMGGVRGGDVRVRIEEGEDDGEGMQMSG